MINRRLRTGSLALASAVLAICIQASAQNLMAQAPATHPARPDLAQRADHLKWGPAPAIFPAGAQMAVLQGDPSVAGAIFTVRLKMPDGYRIPAHWHPTDELVTVMSGGVYVGLGDTLNTKAFLPMLKAGDFINAPAKMNHFAMAKGETILQVDAIGPFQLTYVNPKDDPTK